MRRCCSTSARLAPLSRRIAMLPSSVYGRSLYGEVAGRLQTLRVVTNETKRELRAARAAVTKGQASAELLLDRALSSIEHLNEVAQAMTRQLDDLLRNHPCPY